MAWIDSHCHLNHERFSHDLTDVLQRAMQEGISQFLVPGTAFHQWETQRALEQKYPNIHLAYGIHPWFCDLHNEEHLEQLDDLLNNAVAVGECGLDFSPNKPSKEQQMHWFEAQVTLAKKHQLPLIIHSVKANDVIASTLKKQPTCRGVVHGFAGSLQQAQALIKLGYYIAIGTRLIHSRPKKTAALVTQLPLTSLLLETDAPDGLGKQTRNEPKELIVVANVVAKLRQQQPEEVLNIC
ncbi:MAG TPA: TatD family deoxyribonuclease, partial [Ghiorsea sp.]|nr:TatD family deoxyribonuclease [Ghiorsea sp.]